MQEGHQRSATKHAIFCKTTTSMSSVLKNQIVFDMSNLKVACKFENSSNIDYARSHIISHRHLTDTLEELPGGSYDLHDGNTLRSTDWYAAFNESLPNSLIISDVGRNDKGGVHREIDINHFGVVSKNGTDLLPADSINAIDPGIATKEIAKCPSEIYYYANGKIKLLGWKLEKSLNYSSGDIILEKDGELYSCPASIFVEYIKDHE